MATPQTNTSPTPIERKPFLTTKRAIMIVALILLLGFYALPVLERLQRMISDPGQLVQQLLVGLTKGTYLSVIALGYTLVYGILELINFAHGDVYMIGAFLSLIVISMFNLAESSGIGRYLGLFAALIIVMVMTAFLNAGIERFAYRPLRRAPRLAPLISAIGMSFVLQNVGIFLGERQTWSKLANIFGKPLERVATAMGQTAIAPKSFPDLLPTANIIDVGGVRFTVKDLLVTVLSLGLLAGLFAFVRYTKLGKAIRATAQDRDAAQLMGINADRTISLTFLIGGALAGAAGMIVGLYNGTAVYTMGFTAGLLSFTAAVLGGIGNILGSALGGIIIGLVLALSDQYIGTRWSNAVIFAILVLILLFRPTGLLGQEGGQKA